MDIKKKMAREAYTIFTQTEKNLRGSPSGRHTVTLTMSVGDANLIQKVLLDAFEDDDEA